MRLKEWYEDLIERLEKGENTPLFAHQIVWNAIIREGYEVVDEQFIKLASFESHGIYGIYPTLTGIYQYFKSAQEGFDTRKRLLVLVGPPGTAKSTIAGTIKILLEEYTKENPVPAIKECPSHDNPLFAVPYQERKNLEKYGIRIDPEILPCPVCRRRLKELEEEGKGWEDLEVEFISFSRAFGIGVAEYAPRDVNTSDDSVLIGKMSLSKLTKYSDNDPRVWDYSGAFQKGNRGLVEFIEILKAKEEHLYRLLTATQDSRTELERGFGTQFLDVAIIGHTNFPEFEKFKENPKNLALVDRFYIVFAPYNLDYEVEQKILRKLIPVKTVYDPLILEAAAYFTVASRIAHHTTDNISLTMDLLRWSNDHPDAIRARDGAVKENWGMEGISSRVMANVLSAIYTTVPSPSVVDFLEYIESHQSQLKENPRIVSVALEATRSYVEERLEEILVSVFVGDDVESDVQDVFKTFVVHLKALTEKRETIREGGKDHKVNKELVASIVEGLNTPTTDEGLKEVYTKISSVMSQVALEGKVFNLKEHLPELYRAILRTLFSEKIKFFGGSLRFDLPLEEMKGLSRKIIDQMVDQYSYDPNAARKVLNYAALMVKEGKF